MSNGARRYVVVSGIVPLTEPLGYDAAEDCCLRERDRRNDDPYALLAILNEDEHRAAVRSAREACWQQGMAWMQDDLLDVWAGRGVR